MFASVVLPNPTGLLAHEHELGTPLPQLFIYYLSDENENENENAFPLRNRSILMNVALFEILLEMHIK